MLSLPNSSRKTRERRRAGQPRRKYRLRQRRLFHELRHDRAEQVVVRLAVDGIEPLAADAPTVAGLSEADDRPAQRHGLENRYWIGVLARRQHEEVEQAHQRIGIVEVASEMDVLGERGLKLFAPNGLSGVVRPFADPEKVELRQPWRDPE